MSPRLPSMFCLAAACWFASAARAEDKHQSVVKGHPAEKELPEERATTVVRKAEIEERQATTAAEALSYEPGVFVVQASHGQGLAYVRGLTGQQTLVLFDGIRLNNSAWQRRTPNQHLQTIDARLIDSIEVLRGGGSTREGSDAMGGVILFRPLAPGPVEEGSLVSPRIFLRAGTAEQENGGRFQLDAGARLEGKGLRGEDLVIGVLAGVSLRRVGLLESAGSVDNPNPDTPVGRYPHVPRFAPDGRTQLGTGYDEAAGDARLVLKLDPHQSLIAAAYVFRQLDAPRTDQCPPAYASSNTCLTVEELRRDLVYAAWEGRAGQAARHARITLSWQHQGERTRLDYPNLFARYRNDDQVDTLGVVGRAITTRIARGPMSFEFIYGADTYVDFVRSSASQEFTDFPIRTERPRGQLLDGSRYVYGGAFLDAELNVGKQVTLRAGARLSWLTARAPADPEGSAPAIDTSFVPLVGHAGIEYRPLDRLQLLLNVDHSYRAPNLDDLTGRFVAGPGFQIDNPALGAERATTVEAGARLDARPVRAELWAFETLITDRLLGLSLAAEDCPPNPPQCRNAWYIFKQVNAPGLSEVRGVEASVTVRLPRYLTGRATVGYAWGEGPNLGTVPREPQFVIRGDRIPLSLIPPVNGTVELSWTHPLGFWLGAGMRWAGPQDRLSWEDAADRRIPRYGTPGYVTFDLRGGVNLARRLKALLVVKNLFDSPWRAHGSSVNGAGRGIVLQVEAGI